MNWDLNRIKKMLDSVNIPVALGYYPKPYDFPYLVFAETDSSLICSDDSKTAEISSIQIDLYTKNRDLKLENKVESLLIQNNLMFNKTITYVPDQECWAIVFNFEILKGE